MTTTQTTFEQSASGNVAAIESSEYDLGPNTDRADMVKSAIDRAWKQRDGRSSWSPISDDTRSTFEYPNATRAWKNAATQAEIVVHRVAESKPEEMTDKSWVVQHPVDEHGERFDFFATEEAAVEFARSYMESHPAPRYVY